MLQIKNSILFVVLLCFFMSTILFYTQLNEFSNFTAQAVDILHEQTNNNALYENDELGLSFSYPRNLEVNDIYTPISLQLNDSDDFSDNSSLASIMSEPYKHRPILFFDVQPSPLNLFSGTFSKMLGEEYPPDSDNVLSRDEINISNNKFSKFIFTYMDNVTEIKRMELYANLNNNTYNFAYVSPIEDYDKYLPTAEKIINSIKIKSNSNLEQTVYNTKDPSLIRFENNRDGFVINAPSNSLIFRTDDANPENYIVFPQSSVKDLFSLTGGYYTLLDNQNLDVFSIASADPMTFDASPDTVLEKISHNINSSLSTYDPISSILPSHDFELVSIDTEYKVNNHTAIKALISVSPQIGNTNSTAGNNRSSFDIETQEFNLMHIATLINNNVYSLVFISNPDTFESNLPKVEEMVQSFQDTNKFRIDPIIQFQDETNYGIVLDSENGQIYSRQYDDLLYGIDINSSKVILNHTLGDTHYNIAFDPRGFVYLSVNTYNDDIQRGIHIIDPKINDLVDVIPLDDIPDEIVFNPYNNLVYVDSIWNDTSQISSIIDPVSKQSVANISLGDFPFVDMEYNDYNNHMYYLISDPDNSEYSVYVIEPDTHKIVGNITTPFAPGNIAFNTNDDLLYVADDNSRNVSVYGMRNNSYVGDIDFGGTIDDFVYNPSNELLYVAKDDRGVRVLVAVDPLTLKEVWRHTWDSYDYINQLIYDPKSKDVFASAEGGIFRITDVGITDIDNHNKISEGSKDAHQLTNMSIPTRYNTGNTSNEHQNIAISEPNASRMTNITLPFRSDLNNTSNEHQNIAISEPDAKTPGMSIYQSPNNDFTISYTTDWTLEVMQKSQNDVDDTYPQTPLIMYSPEYQDENEQYATTVDFFIEDLSFPDSPKDLVDYMNASIESYKDLSSDYPDFVLLSNGLNNTLSDLPAYSITFYYTDSSTGKTIVKEIGTIKDDKAYSIRLLGMPAIYEKNLDDFMSLVDTFEIKP